MYAGGTVVKKKKPRDPKTARRARERRLAQRRLAEVRDVLERDDQGRVKPAPGRSIFDEK